jgi:hypothetical protein
MNDPIIFQMPKEWSGLDPLDPQIAKQWMDSNDRTLKPHVVAVPKTWQKATMPDHRFPRGCFARAIQFIRRSPHLPNALYVYGNAACGGFNEHGWVEIEDRVVFDGVMQQFYDKAGYYASEAATAWYRFTRPAVMFVNRQMRKDSSLTYRWDWELSLPWAKDPLNPLLVDLERAKAGLKSRNASKRAAS